MQLEAFMGQTTIIPHMTAGQRSAIMFAKWTASRPSYTPKEFPFDRTAGMADVNVAEYAKLAAADRAAGTYAKSMQKLHWFLDATRDALKTQLSGSMSDKKTELVVGIIGRMNLVLELTDTNFPGGIPVSSSTKVTMAMKEINDYVTQLMERRQALYKKVIASQQEAMRDEQGFKLFLQSKTEAPVDTGSTVTGGGAASSPVTPGTYVDTVPGGGAAIVETPGPVPVEKTAMQKYGPVAALAAGGILAYFTLR